MPDEKPISFVSVNLGDLSKPVNTLVEKLASGAGILFEPYQEVRMARARAKTKLIDAESVAAVSDLERRTVRRVLAEETIYQQNMECIISSALPMLESDCQPSAVSDDWIANFFDKCRMFSDAQMQELWSRILAGEVNEPGKFSKRTVNLVAELDTRDAERFQRLCRFNWMFHSSACLVYDAEDEIYTSNGVTYSDLLQLEDVGLIKVDTLAAFEWPILADGLHAGYHGRTFRLSPAETFEAVRFNVGRTRFTAAGGELSSICQTEPVAGFVDYVLREWSTMRRLEVAELSEPTENHPSSKTNSLEDPS